jgi:hypothetical protein
MAANRRFDTIQDELREAERWLQQLTREQTFRKAGLCSPTFGLHTAASDESHYEVSAEVPHGRAAFMRIFSFLGKWPLLRQIRQLADGTGVESMSEKTRSL